MPQTRTTCPRCRQPVLTEINQLFDVNTDPEAKQRLLSGQYNLIHCPSCGYEGNLSTPIVYHDPNKELLLTFFPSDLGLPVREQERLIGPMITSVTNHLPLEKRKGYLLRPQTMLTMQSLIERILEADGVTRDMIQAQQQRLNLMQRLMTASSEDVLNQIIEQEKSLLDNDFLGLLTRMIEASLAANDEKSARALAGLQQKLLTSTEAGRNLQEQAKEAEEAIKSLQEASKQGLTREKLLELVIAAPNETRLTTFVSMARNGFDYTFFELLTKRIDRAKSEERPSLIELREKLLQYTREIDEEVKKQTEESRSLLEELLKMDNIQEATTQHLPEINELFVELLRTELQAARQNNNEARLKKLQQIVYVLQQASAPPPEEALIQELLDTADEASLNKALEVHKKDITPELIQTLGNLLVQVQSEEQQEPGVAEKLQEVYRSVLRLSMQANLQS